MSDHSYTASFNPLTTLMDCTVKSAFFTAVSREREPFTSHMKKCIISAIFIDMTKETFDASFPDISDKLVSFGVPKSTIEFWKPIAKDVIMMPLKFFLYKQSGYSTDLALTLSVDTLTPVSRILYSLTFCNQYKACSHYLWTNKVPKFIYAQVSLMEKGEFLSPTSLAYLGVDFISEFTKLLVIQEYNTVEQADFICEIYNLIGVVPNDKLDVFVKKDKFHKLNCSDITILNKYVNGNEYRYLTPVEGPSYSPELAYLNIPSFIKEIKLFQDEHPVVYGIIKEISTKEDKLYLERVEESIKETLHKDSKVIRGDYEDKYTDSSDIAPELKVDNTNLNSMINDS